MKPPGRANAFQNAPVKYEWLLKHVELFKDRSRKHLALASAFVQKFGRNLPLHQDPDPQLNYQLYHINEYLEEEQKDEDNCRVRYNRELYRFLSYWVSNNNSTKKETKILGREMAKVAKEVKLGSSRAKPCQLDKVQEYGKCHWPLLKDEFAQSQKESGGSQRKCLANIQAFRQEKWSKLPEKMQHNFEELLEKEYQEELDRMKVTMEKAK
ncbi:hypothetical protein GYMLUDRAFT_64025 [Collybiopsis luxurians FD-317 M1]|uniref:Unplaced genomic scaffold GYMLUscaffold_88, whole genome shotgun sequence n=1 Tax=Collybiopsis luxurians FD-317 M1 TaxID=944289 RepID=A0A0D0C519_9AGAR|nr:hypothetical protein GYMLUDRAFT_64025 [Collybiopsis luxurians FD-317 M1]